MIIIGDVHGCYETLLRLLDQIPKGEDICFVGDLIDRGPNSRKVVELVKSLNYDCVAGNHEDLMINRFEYNTWMMNGGKITLKEYEGADSVLKNHQEWVTNLPLFKYYHDIKNEDGLSLLVSHTSMGSINLEGLTDRLKYDRNLRWDLLWERPFGTIKSPKNTFNIWGHTPIKEPKITQIYADIDTGSFIKKEDGGGYLTALQFPEMKIFQQETIDEIKWTY